MDSAVVVDTNVAVVANGGHPAACPKCVGACLTALKDARQGLVLVDDGQRMFSEYWRNLAPKGQLGAGHAFFMWLWDNQANPARCRQIPITPIGGSDTDFEEFPSDPDLTGFHHDDRKFVAVALGSNLHPEVLNASDTDWWHFRDALKRAGVQVRFLCPELMK